MPAALQTCLLGHQPPIIGIGRLKLHEGGRERLARQRREAQAERRPRGPQRDVLVDFQGREDFRGEIAGIDEIGMRKRDFASRIDLHGRRRIGRQQRFDLVTRDRQRLIAGRGKRRDELLPAQRARFGPERRVAAGGKEAVDRTALFIAEACQRCGKTVAKGRSLGRELDERRGQTRRGRCGHGRRRDRGSLLGPKTAARSDLYCDKPAQERGYPKGFHACLSTYVLVLGQCTAKTALLQPRGPRGSSPC